MIRGGFNYIKISPQNFPELILSAQSATYSDSTDLWTLEKVEEIRLNSDLMITSYITYPEQRRSHVEGTAKIVGIEQEHQAGRRAVAPVDEDRGAAGRGVPNQARP